MARRDAGRARRRLARLPRERSLAGRDLAELAAVARRTHRSSSCSTSSRRPPNKEVIRRRQSAARSNCCRGLQAASSTKPTCRQLRELRRRAKDLHRQGLADEGDFDAYRDACKRFRERLDKHLRSHSPPPPRAKRPSSACKLLGLAARRRRRLRASQSSRQGKLDFDDLLFRALPTAHQSRTRRAAAAALRPTCGCCWSTNSRTPIRCKSSWSRPSAATSTTASCSSSATSSNRSTASAAPARTCSAISAAKIPEPGQLPLTKNFRSQPAILNFVNALFVHAFGDELQAASPESPANHGRAGRRVSLDARARQDGQARRQTGRPRAGSPPHRPPPARACSKAKHRSSPTPRPTAASERCSPATSPSCSAR